MESSSGDIVGRLRTARERLDAKDTAAAVAIYDEVLNLAGSRPDVLVTVSGDLGSTGHISEMIQLVAPRYDARRHGPATGLNLLQAYMAARDATAAQHVLDLLFDLKRPELEERLYGFSNAIAELLLAESTGEGGGHDAVPGESTAPAPEPARLGLVTISKPIWFYGLENAAAAILPPKEGKLRRLAFAPLALIGAGAMAPEELGRPGNELAFLSRALPAWFAELFYFSPDYAPVAALAFLDQPNAPRRPMLFGAEWTTENLRHLVENTNGGLDYIFTGAIRQQAGDYELTLRLWEVRKFRERKVFTARWAPATADEELGKLREAICQFMEWRTYPVGTGIAYAVPARARAWVDVIGASFNLFLVEKGFMPKDSLGSLEPAEKALARAARESVAASLACLSLRQRARALEIALNDEAPPALAENPAVAAARQAVGG